MIAALGVAMLVLTVGSIDRKMNLLTSEERSASTGKRNTASQTSGLEDIGGAGASVGDEEQEHINDDDSPEERIRKRFGLVKIAGVWLPAKRSNKQNAAGGMAGVPGGAEGSPTFTVPLYITTGKLPDGRAGRGYHARVEAVGGVPPYSWSIEGGTPMSGIRLDPASGDLSGTPEQADTATFRVRVSDAAGEADVAEYKLRVTEVMDIAATTTPDTAEKPLGVAADAAAGTATTSADAEATATASEQTSTTEKPSPLSIIATPLAEATAGKAYAAQFTANGGTPPYVWSSAGGLPDGLVLSATGALSGTPAAAGDYAFALAVGDQEGLSAVQNFALKVKPAVPDAVTNLTAFVSLHRIAIAWTQPQSVTTASVRLLRNPLHAAANETDGLLIYEGTDSSFIDTLPVAAGAWYTAFVLSEDGAVSEPASLSVAPKAGEEPFVDSVASWSPLNANAYNQGKLPGIVLGPPQGGGIGSGSLDVVSLGAASVDDPGGAPYGGSIVVSFDNNVAYDGPGADLTVFENVFYIKGATGYDPNSRMMEPAVVSVSQDGQTWFTFPFDFSPRYDPKTGALNLRHPFVYNKGFAGVNPVNSNGYNVDPTDPAASGGDSFDLADLHVPGLTWIRYVRIQSTGDKWMVDADGDLVRHSNTTALKEATRGAASAGFDLDAVAAIWFDAVRH